MRLHFVNFEGTEKLLRNFGFLSLFCSVLCLRQNATCVDSYALFVEQRFDVPIKLFRIKMIDVKIL